MASETELRILIKTVADAQGITLTEKSITQLSSSMAKTNEQGKALGQSSKEASDGLANAGKSAQGTQQFLDGLARAQQGGVQGFLGLITGMRGFISVSRLAVAGAIPFAGFVTIVAGLAAAALSLKDNFASAGTEMGGAKDKADELTRALALIKADTAAGTAFQIKKISDETKTALDRIRELTTALLQLSGNKHEIALDKIKNDPSLSPAQKDRAIFDQENAARKEAFEIKQAGADKEIARLSEEKRKANSGVRTAVSEEQLLRDERASLRNEQSDAEDEARKTREATQIKTKREAGGGITVISTPAADAQDKADAAQERLDRINARIALLDGGKDKGDGLLAEARANTLAKNKAAIETEEKNTPAIKSLELAKGVDASTFATKQTVASNDFIADQKAEATRLTAENAALAKEKAALQEKDSRSLALGGDAAAKARIAEIDRAQSANSADAAQRSGFIPRVKDNTGKLTAQLANEFSSFGAGIETPPFQNPAHNKAPGSGGTITKGGETFHVTDDKSVAAIKEAKEASEKHDAAVAAAVRESAAAQATAATKLDDLQKEATAALLKQTEETAKQTEEAVKQLQAQSELEANNTATHKQTATVLARHSRSLSEIRRQIDRIMQLLQ